jgi:ankyrin repeat protein
MDHSATIKTPPAAVRLADEAIDSLRAEGLVPDDKLIGQLRSYALQQAKAGNVLERADLVAAARQGPDFLKTAKATTGGPARQRHRSYDSVIAKLNAKAPAVELSVAEQFYKACEDGALELVRSLLEQDGVDPAAQDHKALWLAARYGHMEVVRLLLQQNNADFIVRDNFSLRFAAARGYVDMVRLLLEQDNIDPAAQDSIALRVAAEHNHVEIVRLLLEQANVDPAAQDHEALRLAARCGHVEVVRLLLEQHKLVPAAQGNEALRSAARYGHVEVVRLLLEQGIDPAAQEQGALRSAARYGHVEVVRLLLEQGNVADAAQNPYALGSAAAFDHVDVVDLLLEHGAKLSTLIAPLQKSVNYYFARRQLWIAATGDNAPESLMDHDPALFRKDAFTALLPMLEKEGYTGQAARRMAYHAAAFFETEARVLTYLERWGVAGKQPLHDLIHAIKISDQGSCNLQDWRSAVMACGPVMARLIEFADKIPSPLRSDDGKAWSPLKTRVEIAKSTFNRAADHPELAALCFDYLVKEGTFEKALGIVQRTGPQVKNIPDLSIDGTKFDLPGGKFYRLPANDIRGLFLGKLTDCCQSVDGHGHDCAVHGYTKEDGGFYVVENARGQIVAQTWAWRGERNEMCWDTLEVLGENVKPQQWEKLLKAAANDLAVRTDHNVTALTVGTGGDTPKALKEVFKKAEYPAKPRDYKGYRESKTQLLIWSPCP